MQSTLGVSTCMYVCRVAPTYNNYLSSSLTSTFDVRRAALESEASSLGCHESVLTNFLPGMGHAYDVSSGCGGGGGTVVW